MINTLDENRLTKIIKDFEKKAASEGLTLRTNDHVIDYGMFGNNAAKRQKKEAICILAKDIADAMGVHGKIKEKFEEYVAKPKYVETKNSIDYAYELIYEVALTIVATSGCHEKFKYTKRSLSHLLDEARPILQRGAKKYEALETT